MMEKVTELLYYGWLLLDYEPTDYYGVRSLSKESFIFAGSVGS